jgi:NADH:ubiquinone oxidoreductase subunit F (NADH-binding)/NADH:ubiquinone oxidoreductase subunit E
MVPNLHRIQHQYGYLRRDALEKYSKESGIPLHRMQAVASFFPHFQLLPPKKVVLKVCRDMACHMAGANESLKQLASLANEQIGIEGVSCLGRCDRAPAAFVTVTGHEHEQYYLGRSTSDLREIIASCERGVLPPCDHDADLPYKAADWVIDPYTGKPSEYAAVRKLIAARDASLAASIEVLRALSEAAVAAAVAEQEDASYAVGELWPPERLSEFRTAAVRQLHGEDVAPIVEKAVRHWQTEGDWAKGPKLGGWSDAFFNEFKKADLRGLGGAGIPAMQKWKDVRDAVRTARLRDADDRAFIVVNGDESEPATFKDREILLHAPHVVIEAVISAGLLTEATQGFIYIRHEYGEAIEACRKEIARAEKMGLCGEHAAVLGRPFPLSVFPSPGGYICGEQSALIEAMSDRRGEPRNMPPKLETNGLIDLPTLVSNVETYGWVPYILIQGGEKYAKLGVNGWSGRRFFSISGDIVRPGVYEVPMGMTLRELIYGEQYCQGIVGNKKLKAFAPSGPSGGFLPAELPVKPEKEGWQKLAARRGIDPTSGKLDILDLELELNLFRDLSPTQALGAGLVVYAEGRDMAEQAVKSNEFFKNESCGKCVPCRIGSQKLVTLGTHVLNGQVSAQRWKDELAPLVGEMSKAIEFASICGLGRSVPVPLRTVMSYFPDDLAKHFSGAARSVNGESKA